MASTVSYNVGVNITQAQQQLQKLYDKANKLFQGGFNINIDGKKLAGFERSLDQATSRILSFTATTTLLYQTGNALKRLATEAIEVQTAITGIQSILNATDKDLSSFTKSLFDISNKTGVGFFEAAEAANEFSRAGLSLEKTLQATAAALGIVRTSGGNVKDAVQGLIAAVNSFDSENLGFGEVADKLSALDAAFSTSASGLIQAFSRVGVAASDAGVSFDQLGGIIAAVKQISGRSEAQIGNSLKAVFVSLQNSNVQGILESAGIATKNANGEFRAATDVLEDLANAFKTLTDAEKAFISQKVAGKFQANAFATTIQAIQTGLAGRGESISSGSNNDIAKRLEVLNATTATTIQRFQNTITEISSTLGDAVGRNFVEGLLKYGNSISGTIKTIFEKDNAIGEVISSSFSSALTGPGIILALGLLGGLAKKVFGEVFKAGGGLISNLTTTKSVTRELEKQIILQREIVALIQASTAANAQRAAASAQRNANLPPPPSPFQTNPAVYRQQARARLAAIQQARAADAAARAQAAQEARVIRVKQMQAQMQEEKQQRRQRLQSGLFGLSFGVAAGTAAISSQLEDGSTKRLVDTTGQAAATALILSSFGKIGLAGGVVVGGFQILSQALEETYGNIEDLNRVAREQVAQNEKAKQSGDLFVQATKTFEEALKTGSSAVIEKAQRDLASAQRGLDPTRSSLLGLRNVDELIKANDKLNAQTDFKSADNLLPTASQGIIDEAYKGFFAKLGGQFEKQAASSANSGKLASQIVGAIDLSKVKPEEINKLFGDFSQNSDTTDIKQFVQTLTEGLPGAKDAITQFSQQFRGGADALSVAILENIKTNLEAGRLSKLDLQNRKDLARGNKIFEQGLAGSFAQRGLRDSAAARSRDYLLSRFRSRNSGLTGQAGEVAQTQGDLLEARNTFTSSIQSARSSFLPALEEALAQNVEGSQFRGELIGSIDKILGEGFDPNNIKQILTNSLGAQTTANILQKLNKNLFDYNNTVANANNIYQENVKNIQTESRERQRLNLKILGNPREDQSSNLAEILAGGRAFRASQIAKRDRNGNIVSDAKDPFNLSAAKIAAAREDLNRLEIEGKSGIRTASLAENKGRARSDFETLVNSQRVQADSGLLTDLLNEFKALNKGNFGFGEGGFKQFQKDLEKAIQSGNFRTFDNNSVLNSIRQSNLPGASRFITGYQDAKTRADNQGTIVGNFTDEFLAQNDLLKDIATSAKGIYDLLSAQAVAAGKGLLDTGKGLVNSFFQKNQNTASLLKDNQRSEDLGKAIFENQRKLDDIEKSSTNSRFNVRSQLLENSSRFQGLNQTDAQASIMGPAGGFFQALANAMTPNRNNPDERIFNDPAYRGGKLTDDEISDLISLINNGIKSTNDLREAVITAFPDKTASGVTRGEEILRGGFLDPINKQLRSGEIFPNRGNKVFQDNLEREKATREQQIKQQQSEKEAIDRRIEEQNKLSASISEFRTIVDSLSNGISQSFDANIDVNLQGLTASNGNSSIANLKKEIRDVVFEFFKEATGKAPVIAPTAVA